MRQEKVKVAIWGFGAMGSGMARMILKKQGFEIVGVCDANPNYINKSMYEVLNFEKKTNQDIIIRKDINDVVSMASCDVVLLATDSFTKNSYEKIEFLLKNKLNVISTAEEMAFPKANEPALEKKMDELAKANNVTVLGTGINPGMMMDLLVVMMSGVMEDLNEIEVARINSLSPFGKTVMVEQGVGFSLDEFKTRQLEGKLVGHVGFIESASLIANGLGLELTNFSQSMEPIVTEVDRKSPFGFARANDVAGANMKASAVAKDENKQVTIAMHHPQQIEPHLGGVKTGDYIKIKGTPEVNLSVQPEIDGGVGTIAICVNMIPHVINAKSGLKTMLDLPVPRAILGDVRKMID